MLLVEDNDLNVETAKALLTDEDTAVTTVTEGEQAIQYFRESALALF